jgi:hypothetical protein
MASSAKLSALQLLAISDQPKPRFAAKDATTQRENESASRFTFERNADGCLNDFLF